MRWPQENSLDISELDFIVSNDTSKLHAQTLASLCPTGRQNSTTALGCHAGTETVAFSALAGIRLISAFHISIPFVFTEQLPNCMLIGL